MQLEQILKDFKKGQLSLEEAQKKIQESGFSEMGFAKIDLDRKKRTGFAEVIFCPRKADDHLVQIYHRLYETTGEVFGTRASEHQADLILREFKEATYDPLSRILKIEPKNKQKIGRIAVCTAGTADLSVAEEASQTAEFFGSHVDRHFDIGISGLHRLLSRLDELEKANCVIAVAGMEGALPSVLGGLLSVPIIALPTSVGYGANFNGLSALLAMLNSCSNGISVVNIDNGFGAAYIATEINRLAEIGSTKGQKL